MTDVLDNAIDPAHWGQFAALGSVIVLLFALVFFLIRQIYLLQAHTRKEAAESRKETTSERETLLSLHRDERAEWRGAASEDARRMEAVVDRLTHAIQYSHAGQILPPAPPLPPRPPVPPPQVPPG